MQRERGGEWEEDAGIETQPETYKEREEREIVTDSQPA